MKYLYFNKDKLNKFLVEAFLKLSKYLASCELLNIMEEMDREIVVSMDIEGELRS